MKLNDLTERNKKFQDAVAQITELIHHKSVLEYCSQLIRSARRMDAMLRKLLATRNEMQFNTVIESLEDESDEIIFILDQLTDFYSSYHTGLPDFQPVQHFRRIFERSNLWKSIICQIRHWLATGTVNGSGA